MSDDNPIIAEIRRIREEMLAEYGGDLRALVKDMQRRTEEAARAGRKVYSPAYPEAARSDSEPQKKAG